MPDNVKLYGLKYSGEDGTSGSVGRQLFCAQLLTLNTNFAFIYPHQTQRGSPGDIPMNAEADEI